VLVHAAAEELFAAVCCMRKLTDCCRTSFESGGKRRWVAAF